MSFSLTAALPAIKATTEVLQIEHEGKPMVLLKDQEGLISESLLISPSALLIVLLLNGKNSIVDIQSAFTKNTGVVIQEKRRRTWMEFKENPVRKAMHVRGGSPNSPWIMTAKSYETPYGAMNVDSDAFYMSVVANDHWRNVCGLSALYTALRLVKNLNGGPSPANELLAYGQADDPAGGVVSFTSRVFPR